jgi:site-specific DNA recombinase
LIWNRTVFMRNPDTGKRISRVRPEVEWQRSSAAHLRIVDDETFEKAQRLRIQRSRVVNLRAKPKRILSGLLRCGACGGGMSKKDTAARRPRIICTRMHDAGTCDNRRGYYLDDVEHIVIGGLRQELGSREAITYFVRCYNDERKQKAAGGSGRRKTIEAALAEVDRQIERAVAAIIAGRITEREAASHLPPLRLRRDQLAGELESLDGASSVVLLRPAVVEHYLGQIAQFERALNEGLSRGIDTTARAARDMIETVTVMPAGVGQIPQIIVRGALYLDQTTSGTHLGGESGSGGRI